MRKIWEVARLKSWRMVKAEEAAVYHDEKGSITESQNHLRLSQTFD